MDEMSTGKILAGVFFGALGTGYFIYGKKQQDWITLVAGIALMVVPYFIPNIWLMSLTAIGLAVAPFLSRRWM